MRSLGYNLVQGDHTVFIKPSELRGVTPLIVYVDDIIVIRDDKKEKLMFKQCLAKKFEIKG